MKQFAALDDTVYLWFAANDTSGSGGDGATPAAHVRLAGAAADAAPVYSPTPALLSHASYPAGAYEIAIVASAANGFATGNTYAIFCTLAIDSQNPTGFIGSFDLKPVEANLIQIGDATQSATDLKDFADAGYDPATHKVEDCKVNDDMVGTNDAALASVCTEARLAELAAANIPADIDTLKTKIDTIPAVSVSGTADSGSTTTMVDSARTEATTDYWKGSLIRFTSGGVNGQTRLIIGFTPATDTITFYPAVAYGITTHTYEIIPAGFGDVLTDWINGGRLDNLLDAIPTTAMRGTDNAALAATALTNVTWTDALAGYIANINNANLATISDISSLTATEIAYLNAAISSRSSHTAANVWEVGTRALTDKAGFALSTAGILSIWHQLTANIVTANTIGKLLKDDINATISSRSSHAAADVWTAASRALSTPADYKADVSALALEATLTAMKGGGWTDETMKAIKDAVDAISLTAAAVSDAVWDELIADHLGAGSTGTALNEASAPTAEEVADQIWDEEQSGHTNAGTFGKYLDAAISGVGGAIGAGALSCTWTQKKDDNVTPMDNVQVWVTTDEEGLNVIAGTLITNASGQVTFMLDAGTYYVWREKAGENFTNPQEWSVS